MNDDTRSDAKPKSGSKAVSLLILVGLVVYANAVNKGFVFDDLYWITSHPNIGDPGAYIWRSENRPFTAATIQLNYRLGGMNPVGYHLFNVTIHILTGLVLFQLLLRIFQLSGMKERWGERVRRIAFAITILWMVHPLNTQAVTYVIQRAESMMGLLFLTAMYAWIRGATAERHAWLWYAFSISAFFLSVAAKEVGIVFPLVIIIFDYAFLSKRWYDPIRQRWLPYVVLWAVWGYWLRSTLIGVEGGENFGLGFGLQITPYNYALTQTEVIWFYMQKAFLPIGQSGDYSFWPMATSFNKMMPAAIALGILIVLILVGLIVRPKLAFVGCWILGILGPTSSFMPIVDFVFEHRMYLSLIGVITLTVLAVATLLERVKLPKSVGTGMLIFVTCILGVLTVRRNEVYQSNSTFFGDAIAKHPNNIRALGAVAELHINAGKLDEAEKIMVTIEKTNYSQKPILINRGKFYIAKGEYAKAKTVYDELVLDKWPAAWRFWAEPMPRLLLGTNDIPNAIRVTDRLNQIIPDRANTQGFRAAVQLASGNTVEAKTAWDKAVSLEPEIGHRFTIEARTMLFNPGEPNVRAYRIELAYRLASVVCECSNAPTPEMWDTLAMAAAAGKRWPEAMRAVDRGLASATQHNDTRWIQMLTERKQLYAAKKTYGLPD